MNDGDQVIVDPDTQSLVLDVSEEEIKTRLSLWKPRPLPERFQRGVLGKYVKLVSSASTGAIVE